MASAQPVDDSFLDEVDDSFLDEVDAAPKAAPAPKRHAWNDNPALSKVLDDYRKNGESNEALMAAFSLIPTLGLRKQIGQGGAALMDKAMGSELPMGELYDRARPQIEEYYADKAEKHPIATAAGAALGGLPTAMAINPLSAGVAGSSLAPFAKALAGAGAAGVESGALSGLVGFNDSDAKGFEGKGYDALSQAILGGAMGAGASLLPEAIVSGASLAKRGVGKAMKLPAQLREMIGGGAKPAQAGASRADDFAAQLGDMLPKPAEAVPDNVIQMRPDQADVETKMTPIRNLLRDQDGSMYMGGKGGKGPKYKTKEEALRKIFDASGVDGMRNQSAKAGHFNEIERIVGRKVKGTQDAFNALSAMSAKKRGKSISDRDWEDVQTAIRELRQIEGLEDLKLPVDVQEALLPAEKEASEVSFNVGRMNRELAQEANGGGFKVGKMKRGEMEEIQHEARDRAARMAQEAKNAARAKAKDPDFLAKSQELADMLAAEGDTAITPVDMRPNSIHENATPNQIQDGARYAEAQGLNPDMPFSAQGGPHIKHKGAFRDKGYSFPKDKAGWENEPHWWKAGEEESEPGGIMEMMMRETETPQEAAAWEALNKNERNASKWRNPSDVDSGLWRAEREAPEEALSKLAEMPGEKTGKGAKPLYEPMGVQAAARETPYPDTQMTSTPDWYDQVERMGGRRPDAPMTDDFFAQIAAEVNPQGAKNLEGVPWERSPLTTIKRAAAARQTPRNTEVPIEYQADPFADATTFSRRPSMMPVEPIDVPGWQGVQGQAQAPAQASNASQMGRERMEKLGGVLGGAVGTMKAGPLGAWPGYKAGQATMQGANKAIDMAAKLGAKLDKSPEQMAQQMAKNPAMLQQVASGGGPMAGAAKFILQGAQEAGDIGLKARAFVAAAMPQFRELFAQEQ